MGTHIIRVPERALDNFAEPINFLIRQIAEVNAETPEKVVVDFSFCRFISPYYIGGLSSFLFSLTERKCEVEIICERNEELNSYLKTIRFPSGISYNGLNPVEVSDSLNAFKNKTYIPITCFPTGANEVGNTMRENIISTINSIFKVQLGLTGEILKAVYYLVDELTQNVTDHSGCPQGIMFAQYYPAKNYMDLCIVDYGKGLLQSYIETKKFTPKDDAEAINFAVFGKSTKDLPDSRGFGISTSRNMLVNGLRGKFFIMSGNAFFFQTYERQDLVAVSTKFRFEGCYVALRIPVQNSQTLDFYSYVG